MTTELAPSKSLPPPRYRAREVNAGDAVFRALTGTFAMIAVVVLGVVGVALALASRETISAYGLGFITGTDWNPAEGKESYGALPFIFGTLVTSFLALLMAVPVALGVAIFLAELAPRWLRSPMSFLVELLAAVPSVIYGLWGFFVLRPVMMSGVEPALHNTLGFLPFFRGTPQGNDVLLASVVLAIMILPTISAVSREVLRAVPGTLREGALALGATRWEMVRTVVLPYARSGITGAIILGLGRALGETMAITMLIGNKAQVTASLFQPAATMASVIANQYPEAHGRQLSALTEIGLLLFFITLALNVVARLLVWRVGRLPGGARTA
jgi:phosphate transport system permease protein